MAREIETCVPEGAARMPAADRTHFDLRFRLDWNDYAQALRGLSHTSLERVGLILFIAGLIALGIFAGALIWWGLESQLALSSRQTGLGLSISINATALLMFCYFALWPAYFRSSCADLPTARGECHLVADEHGLTLTVVGIALFVPWKAIQQIRETNAHFVLSYTRRSQFVVPKRSFDDAAQKANFLTFARARQVSP
jgi:hypothetical protein